MKERTYVAEYTTRCTQTMLIHNCTSGAEARKKLLKHHADGAEPDVDPVHHESDQAFPKSAKITVDK